MKPDVSRKYRSETHVRMVRETVEVVAETLLRIDYPKVATAERGGSYEPDEAVAKGGSFEPPFACFCCGIRCSTPHQSETQKREGLPLYEVLQAPSHCCNSDLPELQTWMVRSSSARFKLVRCQSDILQHNSRAKGATGHTDKLTTFQAIPGKTENIAIHSFLVRSNSCLSGKRLHGQGTRRAFSQD